LTLSGACWLAGETVSSSRRFRIAEASLALRPAEPVEVWIGASAPPAIDRAARLAQGWIASPASPAMRRACRPISIVSAAPPTASRRAPSSCGATFTSARRRPDARAVLQHALSRGDRGIPAEALIAGSVNEVVEQFRTFGKIGYTDILVRHLTNDQPKVLGSLERLAAVRAALT
jgi:alkanesulfonate monooxygenase SsuD/methylene tetrahydromethanopterin reductase-like flavin-dependent oxidoreductase (luciferase family)